MKPILVLNKEESRFVPAYNVADGLDERTNLAAMDWLDLENLIRSGISLAQCMTKAPQRESS